MVQLSSRRSLLLAGTIAGVLFAAPLSAQQSPAPMAPTPPSATPSNPAPESTPMVTPAPTVAPSAAPATTPSPAAQAPAPAPAPTAQAPAGPPALPPGSPLIGRPAGEAAAKLAPVAPPPLPAAADKLPIKQLTLPRGFNIEVYASGMGNARSMRLGEKNTLFVGTRLVGRVYAVTPEKQVKTIATDMHRPNGLAFHKGTLYVAELSKVSKWDNIEDKLDNPGKPTLITDRFPKDEAHGWKFIGIGPDDKLYVPVGQPGNNVLNSDQHALISRMNLDGSGYEVVARGVRNTVGFDWHPTNRQLYFTDNSRDWVTEDLPEDELNRVTKNGEHFGSPYCYQGNFLDPEFGWGKSCADYTKPIALLGPHTAALGMRFYTGTQFPAKYRNGAFIARHGAWNRTTKVGGDVIFVQFNANGTVKSMEPFLTGFIVNNNYIGRPVDVQPMRDGSLLVSDDWNGAVYRITYDKAKVAGR